MKTWSGPLTRTSVTPGWCSSGSNGPAPTLWRRNDSTVSSTAESLTTRPSARMAVATSTGEYSRPSPARRSRTRSSAKSSASRFPMPSSVRQSCRGQRLLIGQVRLRQSAEQLATELCKRGHAQTAPAARLAERPRPTPGHRQTSQAVANRRPWPPIGSSRRSRPRRTTNPRRSHPRQLTDHFAPGGDPTDVVPHQKHCQLARRSASPAAAPSVRGRSTTVISPLRMADCSTDLSCSARSSQLGVESPRAMDNRSTPSTVGSLPG